MCLLSNLWQHFTVLTDYQRLLDAIIDYSKEDTAIDKNEKYVYTRSGNKRLRKSTAGWKLLVRYKDGQEIWVPLKLMKENFPVETAEFATAKGIDDEAALHIGSHSL